MPVMASLVFSGRPWFAAGEFPMPSFPVRAGCWFIVKISKSYLMRKGGDRRSVVILTGRIFFFAFRM